MGTLHTEADIVRAFDGARDLTNLVVAYLTLWRKYANGLSGVRVPDQNFTVSFLRIDVDRVHFKIVYTVTEVTQEPVYYDVDDDCFQEGYGNTNVSHYVPVFDPRLCEAGVALPFSALLQSKADMEFGIRKFAENEKKSLHQKQVQGKISELESELQRLKGEQNDH